MNIIYKRIGETPLEALERFRVAQVEIAQRKDDKNLVDFYMSAPMTYAGRLDPLAEGALLILVGDECKNKEKYLDLDKEYEVEILLGISTDTYDALGLATVTNNPGDDKKAADSIDFNRYIGRFTQEYPAYSSKTVNGRQLHELARADELPEEMPSKEVEIYSIEKLGEETISAPELKNRILSMIGLVKGDFRQEAIKARWNEVLGRSEPVFPLIFLKVSCSSGTYMRSLADRIGADARCGAFALSIKRTRVGDLSI